MKCELLARSPRVILTPMLLAVLGTWNSAGAEDYYRELPYLPTVKINPQGEGATSVDTVYGKEFSRSNPDAVNDPDRQNAQDGDAGGMLDPLQVVSWDGLQGRINSNSGSVDAFDYGTGTAFNYPEGQIDSLANHNDLLLKQVLRNEASLLFSTTADLGGGRVHYEAPVGPGAGLNVGHGVWAAHEAPAGGPGVNHHPVYDLDALEVWGPEPPSHDLELGPALQVKEGYLGGMGPPPGPATADATRFSLDLDAATGTSVWAYSPATAASPAPFVSPWVPHAEIVAAVEELFLVPTYGAGARFNDEVRRAIDVDATMARDMDAPAGTAGAFWGPGDELLFSIDPLGTVEVMDATGGVAGSATIDGGEIMHLMKTGTGMGSGSFVIDYLNHGGHLWDTAFDVASTFGYEHEDIDALEAVGVIEGTDITLPEPGSIAICGLGIAMAGLYRFRRR
ncbi:hypothetical protein [Aeoliella straminimaris]|nr:hypothetical protein [Aeoliella straminimaris]